jgi:L-threonylcarbamoyladenylate synthase
MIDMIKAANILRDGGLVAFPTETVYGLGADATNDHAIERIFRVKERPHNHPLIVHIGKIEQFSDWALDVSPEALKLAHAFWPGPLTMLFKKRQGSALVTGGQDTIGLRIPRHPVAQTMLQAFGGGIAAPSANKFTHISPTTAADVYDELGNHVDLILDGGECEVGLESTIVDMSGDCPVILRPGMITAYEIASLLGLDVAALYSRQANKIVPGSHILHYAPMTPTMLIETDEMQRYLSSLTPCELPIYFVLRSRLAMSILQERKAQIQGIHCVKMPDDAMHYAHDIYHTLRGLDQQHIKRIVIESVPKHGEWEAICDRLMKASGARTTDLVR